MEYDPVKRRLGKFFNAAPWLRILFYHLLDLLLLRSWHIHRALRHWAAGKRNHALQILDAGAGFGQYTYFLTRLSKKWEILSVDVKEEQVEDCNHFFTQCGLSSVHFAVEDLTQFERPGCFDLIVCVDVMEHIAEDDQVFAHFAQSLKPGGLLLISTPSDQGGSDVHGDADGSFIGEHVRNGYNIGAIKAQLVHAGFSRTEAYYSYGAPGKISWHLSMKFPMQLLNRSRLFFIILPLYYLLTFPFCLVLNFADVRMRHRSGTGLIVRGWK